MTIRRAERGDVEALRAIYNEAIREGGKTAHLEERSLEERLGWFEGHRGASAIHVTLVGGEVAGYVSVSDYRSGRGALEPARELSYYVASAHRGKGLGSRLVAHAIEAARENGVHVLVAIMLGVNEASIAFLRRFGFEECGRVPEAALVDGRRCDHVFMCLLLEEEGGCVD